MEALTIFSYTLAAIVAVTGVVLARRGFRPIVFDYSWVVNAAVWVWGRLKLVIK